MRAGGNICWSNCSLSCGWETQLRSAAKECANRRQIGRMRSYCGSCCWKIASPGSWLQEEVRARTGTGATGVIPAKAVVKPSPTRPAAFAGSTEPHDHEELY